MGDKTTVVISKELRDKLVLLKITEGETLECVIKRLIGGANGTPN